MATPRSEELRVLAQRVTDALPELVEEIVREPLELERCYELASEAGLRNLGTWGPRGGQAHRVSGTRDGVPIELIWWPREHAQARVVAPLAIRPDRLAERIDEALSEPDPRRALLVMTELQLDAVRLAPGGPNVDRARPWLTDAAELLH